MRAPEFWLHPPGLAARLLRPLGALYAAGGRLRHALARPYRSRVPVICIGNLTLGGAGKTPVTALIARAFAARGARPVILARGHGGRLRGPAAVDPVLHSAHDVGDEPLLHAAIAPTVIARDRAAGARLAEDLGAGVILMDDGFQNPGLEKDIAIAVVDAETGFGNGLVFPAGPLRERVRAGLSRAQFVVLMGEGTPDLQGFTGRVARARLKPRDAEALRGVRVLGFAGIGRPEKVAATLSECGAEIAAFRGFPDHHVYTPAELARLRADAAHLGARLVTTEKDLVRIPSRARTGIDAVAVEAVLDDTAMLDALIAAVPERRA